MSGEAFTHDFRQLIGSLRLSEDEGRQENCEDRPTLFFEQSRWFAHFLFALSSREVSAEADHDHARSGSLAAAKNGGGSDALPERAGQRDNQEIGGSVQGDGDRPQSKELEEDVAGGAIHELGNK